MRPSRTSNFTHAVARRHLFEAMQPASADGTPTIDPAPVVAEGVCRVAFRLSDALAGLTF